MCAATLLLSMITALPIDSLMTTGYVSGSKVFKIGDRRVYIQHELGLTKRTESYDYQKYENQIWYLKRSINHFVLIAERSIKVADLIRMTGISKSTVHKIYNEQTSRIGFDTMDKICEALDIEVGDLFTYVPNEPLDKEK